MLIWATPNTKVLQFMKALPLHLQQTTCEVILRYILEKPADWTHLSSEESISEKMLYPGIDGKEAIFGGSGKNFPLIGKCPKGQDAICLSHR